MGEYHRKGFGLKETVKPMLEAAYASRVVDPRWPAGPQQLSRVERATDARVTGPV